MTKYFLIKTETENNVVVTDGQKCYLCLSKNGIDENTEVDLYSDDAVAKLKKQYRRMLRQGKLYSMENVKNDFGDRIFDIGEIENHNRILIIEF